MATPVASANDDLLAINIAKTNFRDGYDQGDTGLVLSVFANSFSDMSATCGPSYWGAEARDVMEARLKALFRQFTTRMVVIIIDVEFYGDVAIDYGWHELTKIPKDGGPTEFVRTRYFEMWKKDAVRGWVITKFFDNLDQRPTLASELIEKYNEMR